MILQPVALDFLHNVPLTWDENEIEGSLIQPFIAFHKNLGSSTEHL